MNVKHFKEHFFSYAVALLTLVAIVAVYYRFMVVHDYFIYDEVECDPYQESCFIYCEDDECLDPFYYAQLERKAYNLVSYCNGDNVDCEAALECQPGELDCTLTQCDPDINGDDCITFTNSE